MKVFAKRNAVPLGVLAAVLAVISVVYTAQGAPPPDYQSLQADKEALQRQLAAVAPTMLVQAGQLAPAPPARPQATGWDTEESIRGGLKVYATYDSSGPDAWDVRASPLVYFTSEGVGSSGSTTGSAQIALAGGKQQSGVHVIDAYAKKVIASALYDIGDRANLTQSPHGVGISPDGKWLYVGEEYRARAVLLVINARTLKLHKVLEGPRRQRFHHIIAFKDSRGRDRVILGMGAGANGGPHFVLDPNNDQKVVKTISIEDIGYKIGHPYVTVDPTGTFIYISVVAPPWRGQLHNTGGIAKYNLETGAVTIIPYVGDHPIGMAHTADGRFTYVNDAHSSYVYKIDNSTNTVVDNTTAGVPGPYGLALNWDETLIYPVGKGEGSHNKGSVLGVVDAKTFSPARVLHNMPIYLGGSASSVDHAILHPDPKVNEMWISNMNGWETIVLDLKTHKVVNYIPTPNGGDTHSGGFVRYQPDWTGELQTDMGGPKRAMSETMRKMAGASAPPAAAQAAAPAAAPAATGGDLVAQGKVIFEKTAGGVGCQFCHGMDGRGNLNMGGPDIRGETEARIRGALRDVGLMSKITLTDAEIAAVVAYLKVLSAQP